MFFNFYKFYIFKFPKIILSIIFIIFSTCAFLATNLKIDASSKTLILDDDKDLKLTRQLNKRYNASNISVIVFTPKLHLLDNRTLDAIENISNDLIESEHIQSVTTILNVPLLQSPVRPMKEILKSIPTLKDKNISKTLVQKEFLESPIYKKNLVSEDFKTTAILINLKPEKKYSNRLNLSLSQNEFQNQIKKNNHENILNIRKIMKKYSDHGTLYLAGVNMITDDIIEFVKSDLSIFGIIVFILLTIVLFIIFKDIKWVIIPITICITSAVITSGILAYLKFDVSVISSNFISLQLIMNMSIVVHLVIKYKELLIKNQNTTQNNLLLETVISMLKPTFFVVITTIAGFSSLVFSGILPVIDFGWMMSLGLIISSILTFIMFPSFLLLTNKKVAIQDRSTKSFTQFISSFVQKHPQMIIFISILFIVFSITGTPKLIVENSFIDYFKKDTQIYQGMLSLDKHLGGTTPLDIVLTFKENTKEKLANNNIDEDSFDDEFDDDEQKKEDYWFTQSRMETISKVHNYLDSKDAIGKVLSLDTVNKLGKILNNGEHLDSLTLALLYKELPQKYKKILLDPYLNIENNQVRFSTRVIDSKKNLRRNELINSIETDLKEILNPKFEQFEVTNLLVIYNNMLQSLFSSQIKTIGVVVCILFLMFLILFRSFKIAIIAIIANTAPVSVIFGFMGWMNIPLDMMTITIAAISIGIAVDNTIHYLHRFKQEFVLSQNYNISMKNAHKSIGKAMFYTSIIIIIGFSVLTLSSFIPTIYFGLLTVLAMLMAIASDLLLLPAMLILFKPLNKINKKDSI